MTITEFLMARIAEDEERDTHVLGCPYGSSEGIDDCECGEGSRVLAECEAKRRIVEWHKNWPVLVETPPTFEQADSSDVNAMTYRMSQQIAWTTEEQYRERFGTEPPSGPMLRALAAVYADHPDYDEAWRVKA